MVMMKNKPKASVVVVGMLSGALITAALAAFDLWIFTYTDSRSGFLGYYSDFAPVAAIVGGVGGLVAGALLGFFLSVRQPSPLLGALAGAIEGVAILFFFSLLKGTSGDTRDGLMFAALVPIGAISGFLTSLIVLEMTSPARREQPRRDRILF
jgi:hypothetical protein